MYDTGVVVTNPYDDKDVLRFPRSMVIDYDDKYLYVASYSNHRVIAFVRDSSTGMLFYKTSAQDIGNYLGRTDAFITNPMDLVLSGDGARR